jgi:nicotinamide mononucleotide adenylyltransferase
MDPTLDPDFVPPSKQSHRIPKIASQSKIPYVSPIQPFMLEDLDSIADLSITGSASGRRMSRTRGITVGPDIAEIPENIPKVSSVLSGSPSSDNGSPRGSPRLVARDSGSNGDEDLGIPKQGDTGPQLIKPMFSPTSTPLDPTSSIPVVQSADLEEVPSGVVRQARSLIDYKFPTHRLGQVMIDESKSPLILVACGSFSPITYLHLRMFEMAMDSIREHTRFEVIGGYYSTVSDNYNKPGLAAAHHRVRMCELACERTSSWLMVDAWESLQPTYTRTALVLDHFNEEINVKRQGVATLSGKRKGVKIMLLAGGDLIESMGEPNVWAEEDLHHILGRYGCIIVERTGSDVRSFLLSHDIMYEHRRNVLVIKQLIYNDISSTKVRLFLRRGMSVQYLLPNSVIRYILEHGLYINESEPVKQVLSERGD